MGKLFRMDVRGVAMALAVSLLAAAAAHAEVPQPAARQDGMTNYIGYHGPDGSQVYKNSNPPVEWDSATGKNILWQTPLPYLGYGGPLVVGDRVFAVSEPGFKNDFPVLTCLEANTGKVLWNREINHLALALPDEAERKRVTQVWHDHLTYRREYMQLKRELDAATDKAAIQEKMKAKGMFPLPDKRTPKDHLSPVSPWRLDEDRGIKNAGLFFDAWRTGFGGWYPGATFATPCTDGESVFVATAWRSYACFDREGNQKWMQWFASKGRNDHSDGCGNNRSPLVWHGLVLVDNNDWVHALDAKTGKVVWEVSRSAQNLGQHEIASPVLFTVAQTDLVWCNGPLVIRLKDGKPLKPEGWNATGMMVVPNPDEPDVLFMTGGGEHGGWPDKGRGAIQPPAAVKFALEGDNLKATPLWTGVDGQARGANCATLVYYAGKVYYCDGRKGMILDAKTGKTVGGPATKSSPENAPGTTQSFAIASGRIYGLGRGEHGSEKRKDDLGARVIGEVFSLDGKKLAANTLSGPKLEGEFKEMRITAHTENWFSYSNPFILSGDRIYVRGCYMLYCIGAK